MKAEIQPEEVEVIHPEQVVLTLSRKEAQVLHDLCYTSCTGSQDGDRGVTDKIHETLQSIGFCKLHRYRGNVNLD